MRAFTTVALAALVSSGVSAPASAFSFTPKNTNFYATGPVTITTPNGPQSCTLTAEGVTTGEGVAEFINASLTGTSDDCFTTFFAGTPYAVTPVGLRRGKIQRVAITGSLGSCGPGALRFSVNKTGVWTVDPTSLAGGCSISAALATSPRITIAP